MIINFKELLKLNHDIGGCIDRVISPRGVRKEEDGRMYYSLKKDFGYGFIFDKPDCKDIKDRSIWVVVDICHWDNSSALFWNIYLVVFDGERAYPVAEFLDSPETLWVKEALPIIKKFFNGDDLEEISLTPQPKKPKVQRFSTDYSKFSKPKKNSQENSSKSAEKIGDKKSVAANSSPKAEKGLESKSGLKSKHVSVVSSSGKKVGTFKVRRHNSKFIEIDTKKGVMRFNKATKELVNTENFKNTYVFEWA